MQTIESLRAELYELVKVRSAIVDAALQTIKAANRDFDREATRVQRAIAAIKPDEEQHVKVSVPRKTTAPKRRITIDDGFTQEEIDTYYELLKIARK